MDARDYPEAYLIEDELTNYGTRNHVLDKAAKEITTLRAKVAELQSSHDALEAKLAKYENLEPVAYSVMCDGEHPGNVFGQKQTAESMMQSLDESWPEHSRKVVPLYALEK